MAVMILAYRLHVLSVRPVTAVDGFSTIAPGRVRVGFQPVGSLGMLIAWQGDASVVRPYSSQPTLAVTWADVDGVSGLAV